MIRHQFKAAMASWEAVVVGALAILVVGSGCTVSSSANCTDDSDCGAGEECISAGGIFAQDGVCVDRTGEFDVDEDTSAGCDDVECTEDETCYRGVCYPYCDDDTDCEADDACFQKRCQPTDCDEIECLDAEICYRGVCYESCDADADCDSEQLCVEDARCMEPDCQGVNCAADETCYRGVCYSQCPSGEQRCGADCVETSTDPDHCGECDHQCAGDEFCSQGVCATDCPGDTTACSGGCHDLQTSVDHCGACDAACTTDIAGAEPICEAGSCDEECADPDHTVCDGVCVDLDNDDNHCGTCNNSCSSIDTCVAGTCVCGQECCSDADCTGDGVCIDYACATAPFVYAGSGTPESLVRKLGSGGELIWEFDGHTDDVLDVAVDPDGYVYTASADNTVRKIDPDGEQVWTYTDHTDDVRSVAVDSDGYVYTTSMDETAHKITPGGDNVWSFDDAPPTDVDVGDDGRVYLGTIPGSVDGGSIEGSVWRLNASGTPQWAEEGEASHQIAVGAAGDVYTGGWWPEISRRFSAAGTMLWQSDWYGGSIVSVVVGDVPSGVRFYAVTSGTAGDSSQSEMYKKDADGEQIWMEIVSTASPVQDVAVDPDGHIYVAGGGSHEVKKYDTNANLMWRFSDPTAPINGVAVDPGAYGAFPDAW